MSGDDPTPPSGHVERQRGARGVDRPVSYAPAVARLRRGLPALPEDRRRGGRPGGQPWRGRLVDLER
jgi:hypothetical protein